MGAPNPAADEVTSYANCHSDRYSIGTARSFSDEAILR